jgi:hypothetical protein
MVVNISNYFHVPFQGGAFSAGIVKLSLRAFSRVGPFGIDPQDAGGAVPRVASLGLLYNGCPVQQPSTFFANASTGEAYTDFGGRSVQADGYFFCFDLVGQTGSGKAESQELDSLPQLKWAFDISIAGDSSPLRANETSASAAGKMPKWTPMGSSVWTRRYRFLTPSLLCNCSFGWHCQPGNILAHLALMQL